MEKYLNSISTINSSNRIYILSLLLMRLKNETNLIYKEVLLMMNQEVLDYESSDSFKTQIKYQAYEIVLNNPIIQQFNQNISFSNSSIK